MRFRWVGLLALWTLLSGPMFAVPEKGNGAPSKVPARQPAGDKNASKPKPDQRPLRLDTNTILK